MVGTIVTCEKSSSILTISTVCNHKHISLLIWPMCMAHTCLSVSVRHMSHTHVSLTKCDAYVMNTHASHYVRRICIEHTYFSPTATHMSRTHVPLKKCDAYVLHSARTAFLTRRVGKELRSIFIWVFLYIFKKKTFFLPKKW